MPEQTVLETKPTETPIIPVETKPVETPKEDLITRVSKVELKTEPPKEQINTFGLTQEDWTKVQSDPTLKKYYDSMHSDYQRKTQSIADLRKDFERKQIEQNQWTPEKVNSLLKDDNFVKAAATVVQTSSPKNWTGTEEKWSSLTDGEKQEFTNMQNRMQQLEAQNFQNSKIQQDAILKTRYANYAPDIVDTTINKLVKMEQVATREDVWKVIDYESGMGRAYKLGYEDAKKETSGGVASLPSGVQTQAQSQPVEAIKGESDRAYFKRLAEKRLAEAISQRK